MDSTFEQFPMFIYLHSHYYLPSPSNLISHVDYYFLLNKTNKQANKTQTAFAFHALFYKANFSELIHSCLHLQPCRHSFGS